MIVANVYKQSPITTNVVLNVERHDHGNGAEALGEMGFEAL
jgi:hypothetical protein